MELVACPFDVACVPNPCWNENGYEGHRCPDCDLIFVSPRPTEQEMADLYNAEATGNSSTAIHLNFNHERRLIARYALDFMERSMGGPKPGATLLEIGPGGGQFLCEARDRGYKPHGVEVNVVQASFIRDTLGIPACHGAVTDPDIFPGQKFDIIYHRDLASHLHQPIDTFAHLRQRLAPGGIMVFETGNGGDLSDRWLKFMGELSYPEHLYLFGNRSLSTLLEESGFEMLDVRRHSIVPWLAAIRMIRAVRPKKPATTPANTGAQQEPIDPTAQATSWKSRLKGHLVYTVKYRAFRWLPKSWPSTLLVAAKAK